MSTTLQCQPTLINTLFCKLCEVPWTLQNILEHQIRQQQKVCGTQPNDNNFRSPTPAAWGQHAEIYQILHISEHRIFSDRRHPKRTQAATRTKYQAQHVHPSLSSYGRKNSCGFHLFSKPQVPYTSHILISRRPHQPIFLEAAGTVHMFTNP